MTQSQTTTVSLLHHVIGGSHGVQTDTVLSVNQVSDRPCVIKQQHIGLCFKRQANDCVVQGVCDVTVIMSKSARSRCTSPVFSAPAGVTPSEFREDV